MQRIAHNAPDAPAAASGYAQAVEVVGVTRMLFISGQIPVDLDGSVPDGFLAQARLAWANVGAQLRAAGMGWEQVVKVTVYLSDRAHSVENRAVRREVLGDLSPALTVIITGIFDAAWLLEIEAIAAA